MSELDEQSKVIRRHLVDMITRSKSSHLGTCLSIVDALAVLYFRVMKIDPTQPKLPTRDRFVLSKAHGSAALYATLAERGFFDKELLKRYYVDDGILPGHLDKTAAPGVETSGGSLGHGLGLGLGMALANRIDGNPGHVYVIVGDGECNEGSVWEAVMLGAHLKLTNLTVLVDYNQIQSYGRTNEVIDQSNMPERWKTFGWDTIEINGHSHAEIESALRRSQVGPKAIVMNTVKGKGVSFMEDRLSWHYKSPNPEEYALAMEELK